MRGRTSGNDTGPAATRLTQRRPAPGIGPSAILKLQEEGPTIPASVQSSGLSESAIAASFLLITQHVVASPFESSAEASPPQTSGSQST